MCVDWNVIYNTTEPKQEAPPSWRAKGTRRESPPPGPPSSSPPPLLSSPYRLTVRPNRFGTHARAPQCLTRKSHNGVRLRKGRTRHRFKSHESLAIQPLPSVCWVERRGPTVADKCSLHVRVVGLARDLNLRTVRPAAAVGRLESLLEELELPLSHGRSPGGHGSGGLGL